MKTLRIGLMVFALLLLSACSTRDTKSEPDLLTADASAAGVQHLILDAGAGEAHVQVSSDNSVHVQLDLRQDERTFLGFIHWVSDDTTKDLSGAKVLATRKGDILTLSLAYPSGGSHSDVKEKWSVKLPARLTLEAHMDAGRLVIQDIAGGIDARLGAGDLTIHSPQGPVQAAVQAGRLHVISDSTQPGNIVLKSTFGLAVLDLDGTYYGPPETENKNHFFGNDVLENAGGKDDMRLKVFAGLVDLRVGPQGDEKEYRKVFADEKD